MTGGCIAAQHFDMLILHCVTEKTTERFLQQDHLFTKTWLRSRNRYLIEAYLLLFEDNNWKWTTNNNNGFYYTYYEINVI